MTFQEIVNRLNGTDFCTAPRHDAHAAYLPQNVARNISRGVPHTIDRLTDSHALFAAGIPHWVRGLQGLPFAEDSRIYDLYPAGRLAK